MIEQHKIRNVKVIIEGYGVRTVFDVDLKTMDLNLPANLLNSPKLERPTFNLKGEVKYTSFYGRKHLKKFKELFK